MWPLEFDSLSYDILLYIEAINDDLKFTLISEQPKVMNYLIWFLI